MSGGRCSLNADARQIRGADASVRTEKLPEGPEWSVEPKLDGTLADWTGFTTDPVGVSDILASGVFGAFKPGTGQYPAGVPNGVNVTFLITGEYVVSIFAH
jgi:hypothetical protein